MDIAYLGTLVVRLHKAVNGRDTVIRKAESQYRLMLTDFDLQIAVRTQE